MVFLGTTFFSGKHALDPTPTKQENITQIALQNGTFDQLFVSKNTDLTIDNIYDDWNYDTVLNAHYNDTFDAGNSGFSLSNTDVMLVKCREKGSMEWKTIYTKDINAIDDFHLHEAYKYGAANTDYEFMLVSTCNGIENSYVLRECRSEFDGMYICDKDNMYGTIYDLEYMDTTANINNSVLELMNSRYANVISHAETNYESSSATGSFLKINQDNCTVDLKLGTKHREELKKWLTNKKPKILKFYDGRIWLICVVGKPTDVAKGHIDLRQIKFDWVEIGNVNDMEDLYNNNLSDVERKWWY